MIFLSNAAGVITAAIPEPINQGSVGVNRIVLIAPFPSTSVVSATFTLPNGIKIYPRYVGKEQEDNYQYLMGVVGAFSNKELKLDGVTVNAWQLTLDKAITQVAGKVTVQFLVTTAAGTTEVITDENGEKKTIGVIIPGTEQTLTTTSATLPINRGNAYLAPSVSDKDINTISGYLAAAEQAKINAEAAEKAAKTAATNAQTAQDYAETAADEAERAKQAAAGSATAAADSAGAAASSAESAAGSASAAANSATAASNSATAAENAQGKAEAAANRASPWDLVITPQNANDVFANWTQIEASSILFFNIDFSQFVYGEDAYINFDDSTRKLEFRGCTFEDEQGNPIKISFYYYGSQCSIEGAKGDQLVIQGFTDVIDCRANIIKDCEYVTACDANTLDNCECVTDSTASTFTNCKFVDPYSVKGFVPVIDNGKVPTLSQSGGYVPKQLPAKIVLAVDDQYIVTATLKDVNNNDIDSATIDLPLESVVVKATVSEEDGQKFLILTLQNGEETKIPLEDIFRGLATEDWVNAQISDVNTTINGIGTRVTDLEDGLEKAETDISTLKEDMSAAETEIDELKRSKLDSEGLTHSSDGANTSFGVGDGVVIHSRQSDGEIVIQGYEKNGDNPAISYFTSITAGGIAGIPYADIASKTEATILKKRVDNIEGAAIDFVIDSTDAVTKTVPTDALPYAKIMKIGGKTVVEDVPFEGLILKSAPVTELVSETFDGGPLDTFTIPEAVRPANGINANACDYIAWEADGTRKKYVCIAIVDASSLTWYYDSSTNVFYTASLNNEKATGSTNVLCTRYDTATVSWANMGDKMIAGASGDSVLRIKDTEYGSDLTSFRNSLAGVQIAYEMKTPTVTDISNILTPDNYIEVGGGGEIRAINGGKGAPITIYFATEKTGG